MTVEMPGVSGVGCSGGVARASPWPERATAGIRYGFPQPSREPYPDAGLSFIKVRTRLANRATWPAAADLAAQKAEARPMKISTRAERNLLYASTNSVCPTPLR